MEPILNLSPQEFRAALAELQLDPQREADLVRLYEEANAPQQGGRDRGMLRNLLDNIIGFDDEVVTPGERLGAGVEQFAGGLLSDPLGMAGDIAQGGYETIERAMAPGATPMDVMGAAGMAMLGGGMVTGPRGALRSGLLRDAADETPAQRVARLLREGRADEVTDDLMAQADPQEMFRLYEAGETGADMPMDEASRMQRAGEMGFGGDWYHGTGNDIQAFDDSPLSRRVRADEGVFLASKPSAADGYGDTLMPLTSKRAPSTLEVDLGNPREVFNMIPEDQRPWSGSFADYRETPGYGAGEILPRDDFADVFADYVNSGWDVQYSRVNDVAGDGRRGRHTILQVADPRNIRSRFARFDPRLSNLRNLNAANVDPLTGAAAVSASQQDDPLANLRAYIAAAGGVLPR
jgi:hypothetical protein